MNKKQLTDIKYHLCEYILQRYGIELHGEPEIEELAKKIIVLQNKSTHSI